MTPPPDSFEYRLSYRYGPTGVECHSAQIDGNETEAQRHLAEFKEHSGHFVTELWIERRPVLPWERIGT